jgi:hypothetical protein
MMCLWDRHPSSASRTMNTSGRDASITKRRWSATGGEGLKVPLPQEVYKRSKS